jgi:hypothetical protein
MKKNNWSKNKMEDKIKMAAGHEFFIDQSNDLDEN